MRSRLVVSFLCALLLAAAPAGQLRLGDNSFDWSTVEQDQAHFRWSAQVINESTATFDVKVTVELLDEDDAVIHRDSATTSLRGNERRTVRHEGSLPFDRAADVVRFRFRLDPGPSQGR